MTPLFTAILLLASATVFAQSMDELKRDGDGGSTDNVVTFGMGYHQQRYSPLKQIGRAHV